ncbi:MULTISPECIES: His-Xaa-Ser system radical SAM maturase HxsB [unclassified Rhizobium]|uniref:His-Xaa-Ser system radical SAM maturase HxsB n=1 Tax=unclassified Rhizobium TaxID=2613769 RepID=UPI001ADD3C9E|nr:MULTISPECIES: His-Xaa-Ser system radical SAM maturase HxsB [unclassified Rhizobium]MBO9102184.1 His-Xaa-Ser system radical SAM maturase HxsB [Rhizobium sp. L58/93]MBO9172280.1 His-Xaa-Ser system radical SAM maturase HxsB [Rhizobium sp. L245/93]MBO9188029.1 His-Xaa-Ser system radical SAM maturase HxsB [Rhizobium sp. E27B/91]QXZ86311.1 His-Xaa-Ser system radical SAM maturase HxsB [Rhizobium sp. K1/93]QXZ92234.1 His-Xaa-Ser system radical SAM maturase HxsB [Rhizobium sp. K15/93]
MTVFPLKFRQAAVEGLLFADDAGGYFRSDQSFLERYAFGQLNASDTRFLAENGHSFATEGDLDFTGFAYRWAKRLHVPTELQYLILVPTLRCNLACGYCQVSRVNEGAAGFDWNHDTLGHVIQFLDKLPTTRIKIEFQGGEPLLRLDLLEAVRTFVRQRFDEAEFVVCTNLQTVSPEAWNFLAADDTYVSTSLDGNRLTHERQRTVTNDATNAFFANLRYAVDHLEDGHVSALPTLDIRNLPSPSDIIEAFGEFGLRSIFLRPVNFQGFARKKFDAKDTTMEWNSYHAAFIDALIEHNATAELPLEEYYFVHCLRRVLRSGHDGHVDLRNPNVIGRSYLVIDYDGTFYPTDEARMVTRVGQLDLSMGNVRTRLQRRVIDTLNSEASNISDPDCIHCPYQAFCGVDLVDDLSRYGRIDMPKHLTHFCQRHTAIFDKVFELLYSNDPKVHKSLAIWAGIPEFDPSLAKVHS